MVIIQITGNEVNYYNLDNVTTPKQTA